MRPINNIVDITNFVMLEMGQPLHAFDCNRLAGGRIVVRCPQPGEETFTTLDNVVRHLEPDMLMICDAERPVAVAGIMGGLESEVTETTTEVLLESACFNPLSIRGTSRRLNIPSEASYRFERGVDPEGVDMALERAVRLMVEIAGAELVPGGIDAYPGRKQELVLPLRVERVCELLGMNLDEQAITDYLTSIEFTVQHGEEGVLLVAVPSFRVDIEREIDLVEEIARLVGYNDIPTTLPQISMDYLQRDPMRLLCGKAADICIGRGFSEAVNYSFIAEKHFDLLGLRVDDPRREVTRLLNPLSEDQDVMRSMLLPSLLDNIRHNYNYQNTDIALFEIGKVFFQTGGTDELPDERVQLCAVMSGRRYSEAPALYFSDEQADVFDLKGLAATLFDALSINGRRGITFAGVQDEVQPYCLEGYTILIQDGRTVLGMIGRINPRTMRSFGIKQQVYFLELDMTAVNELPRATRVFEPLPRFPSVKRDIALLVPEYVAAGDLLETIRTMSAQYVENADLFDVYRGKPIEKGMKSVALSVTYRSQERTLDDETVDRVHEKIVNTLMARFEGRYREGEEIR
jgi:phenylalanyl-tRNA synthetase beta chain